MSLVPREDELTCIGHPGIYIGPLFDNRNRGEVIMGPHDIPGLENAQHRYDMEYDNAEETEDDIPGDYSDGTSQDGY